MAFNRRSYYVLGAIAALSLAIKLLPFFRFGPFAFGYDTGFYRRYLIEPFISFPNTPVPGLDHTIFVPRIVLDIVRFFIAQPDIALYGTYVLFSTIGLLSVWYFASHYLSEKASLYAASLYALSGIQFNAYLFFFFKEVIALPLFLLALVCFEKKRYWLAALLGVLVVLTQQTTAILLIAIAGVGFLFRAAFERTISFGYIFSGTAILASYLFLHPHVAQKIASPPVGVFITETQYLLWSLPLIALALLGSRRIFPLLKQKPLLAAALTVTCAFAVFHLPFYNRIYVFLDLFLAVPAAFGVEAIVRYVSSRTRRFLIPVCILLFALASIPLVYLEAVRAPLIPESIQDALPGLSELPPESAVITSPSLLPWVQGWSMASVYAPGNLKEPHSLNDWSLYWTHQDLGFERDFLSSFPRPLYVFVGEGELRYRPQCATPMGAYLSSLDPCSR